MLLIPQFEPFSPRSLSPLCMGGANSATPLKITMILSVHFIIVHHIFVVKNNVFLFFSIITFFLGGLMELF